MDELNFIRKLSVPRVYGGQVTIPSGCKCLEGSIRLMEAIGTGLMGRRKAMNLRQMIMISELEFMMQEL